MRQSSSRPKRTGAGTLPPPPHRRHRRTHASCAHPCPRPPPHGSEQLKALGFRCHHDERYWELGPRQFSAEKEQLQRTLLESGELPAGSPRSPAVTPTKRRLGASGAAAFDAGAGRGCCRQLWPEACMSSVYAYCLLFNKVSQVIGPHLQMPPACLPPPACPPQPTACKSSKRTGSSWQQGRRR